MRQTPGVKEKQFGQIRWGQMLLQQQFVPKIEEPVELDLGDSIVLKNTSKLL